MKFIKSLFIVILLLISQSSFIGFKGDSPGNMPDAFSLNGSNLVLNGSGIREKYMIDIYNTALYLKQRSKDAGQIVNANELMSIKIFVISGLVTEKRLRDGLEECFDEVLVGANAVYRPESEKVIKALSENVRKGSNYDIVYDPEKESTLIMKDNQIKTEISGLGFKKLLFSIWLGEDPIDKKLKSQLLGNY